ncbi:hypothetical protein [Amycolatopsis kentuckyensis]|uniref:hypothetical protein n=1 Tax=Amycolatopsis kentuckyensis TaxID=218823 RepID=UPI003567A86F
MTVQSDPEDQLGPFRPPLGTPHATIDALRNLGAAATGANPEFRALMNLPQPEEVSREACEAGLLLLPRERGQLDRIELQLIEGALDRGATLTSLAERQGITRQTMSQRYRALGGARELSPGRPKSTSPGYTTTKWWVACTIEGLDDVHRRGEVQAKGPGPGQAGGVTYPVFGGGFTTEEPVEEGRVVYLGTLPDVGDDPEPGVVAVHGNENPGQITTTPVYVRAEHVALEAK